MEYFRILIRILFLVSDQNEKKCLMLFFSINKKRMKVKIAFALFVVAQVISLDLGDDVKNNLVQTVGSLKSGDISRSANEQFEFS